MIIPHFACENTYVDVTSFIDFSLTIYIIRLNPIGLKKSISRSLKNLQFFRKNIQFKSKF
jgi:hypothetical protein